MLDRPDFPDVLTSVSCVDGWMTSDQASRLYDCAAELVCGARIVEIGSFRGRSLIVLASAAVEGVQIISVDPHAGGDRGPQEITSDQEVGNQDFLAYNFNLNAAGVRDRIDHIRKMSSGALNDVEGPIDLLHIDGAHRFGPARADIKDWGDKVSDTGVMLIHDSFSSIGVTLALMTSTFLSRDWRYAGRTQSLAEYRRETLNKSRRVTNLIRQVAQVPWFVRNVVIKVLLSARLYPLTRLLGHKNRDWPY